MSDQTADLLVGLRDGAWLDAQEFPPLAFAVPGLLPEGFGLTVGPPKSGKSWLSLDMAIAVAGGGRSLGHIAHDAPRPVLYLALEDGDRRLQDRCRKLLGDDPIPEQLHYLTRVEPGRVVETIEAFLDGHPSTSLVIVDTLGRVMPPSLPGESAYGRDYRVGARLKRIADERPGLALTVNHHDRKASADDFVDSVSGTHGLAGSADYLLVPARPRGEYSALLKATGRDIPEAEYAIRFDHGCQWVLDGGDLANAAARATQSRAAAGLGDRSAEIIAYVSEHPDGVRASEVEEALGADARRYLARLVDSERIVRISRGLYGPVPSVPMSQTLEGEWDNGTDGTPSQEGTEV